MSRKKASALKALAEQEWLSLEEFALLYKISVQSVRRAIKRGEIDATNGLVKLGRLYRINREAWEKKFLPALSETTGQILQKVAGSTTHRRPVKLPIALALLLGAAIATQRPILTRAIFATIVGSAQIVARVPRRPTAENKTIYGWVPRSTSGRE